MKRKASWIKHVITVLTASALLIGFLLLCAACYWRGLADGRKVYQNKLISCAKNKKGFYCKIMEE